MKKLLTIAIAAIFLFLPAKGMAGAVKELNPLSANTLLDMVAKNKGKIVIINFFATWCPPCRAEIPDLVKFYNKVDKDKVVLIGLSIDEDQKPVPEFLEKLAVSYPVYKANMDIAAMYGVRSIPHNTVYDPSGKMVVNTPGIATEEDLQEFIKTVWEAENKK